MTMVRVAQIAEQLGMLSTSMNRLCATGAIKSAEKRTAVHGGSPHWWCDPDEAIAVITGRSQAFGWRAEPPMPAGTASPVGKDGLTDEQRALLTGELRFHRPTTIKRLAEPEGALRIAWSDGETYTLYRNGETMHHEFTKEAIGDGR